LDNTPKGLKNKRFERLCLSLLGAKFRVATYMHHHHVHFWGWVSYIFHWNVILKLIQKKTSATGRGFIVYVSIKI